MISIPPLPHLIFFMGESFFFFWSVTHTLRRNVNRFNNIPIQFSFVHVAIGFLIYFHLQILIKRRKRNTPLSPTLYQIRYRRKLI